MEIEVVAFQHKFPKTENIRIDGYDISLKITQCLVTNLKETVGQEWFELSKVEDVGISLKIGEKLRPSALKYGRSAPANVGYTPLLVSERRQRINLGGPTRRDVTRECPDGRNYQNDCRNNDRIS
jgi:hypothetical protein